MKAMKKFRQPVEHWSFGTGLIVGCFLVSLMCLIMSKNVHSPILNCPSLTSSWALLSDATPVIARKDGGIQPSGSVDEEREFIRIEVPQLLKNSSSAEEKISRTVISNESEVTHGIEQMCDFSQFRLDICDLKGDIRIIGRNISTVMLVGSRTGNSSSSFSIRPYPRKYDSTVMAKIRPLNLTAIHGGKEAAPRCTVNHTVPGILFSTSGYCGNCFHDFADVLIPLFETAAPFHRRVRFIIASHQDWWMHKYRPLLRKLSAHAVIDYDSDDGVHCFRHLIVGLRAKRDLMIDSGSKGGLSIMDFVKLARNAYSLRRRRASTESPSRKPRLLFIARGRTRRFVNLDEVVPVAEEVGFEVVVSEPDFLEVGRFARTVNSCDVMVGVHGAGLTNLLFLPTGAVVLQVVPLGKLDWIATNFYAKPAMGMRLRYLQYNISVEESTLIDMYPREHQVFQDPESIHKEGWLKMGDVYLKQQNVKLDVKRFRPVLEKALEQLHQKK